MNRFANFAPAAMLVIFNAYAQQSTAAYTFKPLIATGSNIGGYTFTPDTAIDGVALNDSGAVVFVARWTEAGRERTALFSSSKLIAQDGMRLDGRILKRILPTSLNINRAGTVGFEATAGNANQIAVFIGNKFGASLAKGGEPNDFILTDDGKVMLQGATLAASDLTQMANDANRGNLVRSIPGTVLGQIPIRIPGVPRINPATLIGQQSPEKRATQGKPDAAPRPCKAPEYPYPYEWNIGTAVTGPIASHLSEGPATNRTYDSPFFGRIATPFREIQCSAAGTPLVIVIGDAPKRLYEIYTGNGLLTHTRPGGFLDLPGVMGNVLPGQVIRGDTFLRINRVGQIVMPVTLEPEGFALLLATPKR
jgi:hypothetical protein